MPARSACVNCSSAIRARTRGDRKLAPFAEAGTGNPPGFPELNIDRKIVDAAVAQLEAFREGALPNDDMTAVAVKITG